MPKFNNTETNNLECDISKHYKHKQIEQTNKSVKDFNDLKEKICAAK